MLFNIRIRESDIDTFYKRYLSTKRIIQQIQKFFAKLFFKKAIFTSCLIIMNNGNLKSPFIVHNYCIKSIDHIIISQRSLLFSEALPQFQPESLKIRLFLQARVQLWKLNLQEFQHLLLCDHFFLPNPM